MVIITVINEEGLLKYSKNLFSQAFGENRIIDALPRRSVYNLDEDTEIMVYPIESMGAATFCMVRSNYLDQVIELSDLPGLTSPRPSMIMGIGHIKRHTDIGRMSSVNRFIWGDIQIKIWDSSGNPSYLQTPIDSSEEWYMDVSLQHEATSTSGFCIITASSTYTYEQLLSKRTS